MDGIGLGVLVSCSIATLLVGCGPVVDSSDSGGGSQSGSGTMDGSSGKSDSDTSIGPHDVATSDPLPPDVGGAILPSIAGEHLFAVAAVIDPAHPLQWLATVNQKDYAGGATLTVSLQSLALDPQSTTTPRTPVGEPRIIEIGVDADGRFGIELGEVLVPGAANPITGSDIVTTLVLEGSIVNGDLWCGNAFGMVTQPLMLDLNGSTFAGTRILGEPLGPVVSACP